MKREIFTLKRKSGPFFLTALRKLIFTLKMVTRNRRTLKVAVGPTMSASFIAVQLSLCTTGTKATHPHLFVILTNISDDWPGYRMIFMQVKCSQHVGKIEPSSGFLLDSHSDSINLISPLAPS